MFAAKLETDLADYQGTLQAASFEGLGPIFPPTNVIRSDQAWGVRVDWEVHGPLVEWLDAEFRISVFLESIGTGPEYNLPQVNVSTLSIPVVVDGLGNKSRTYTQNIDVAPGQVQPGIYKIATALQLFEKATGNPTPVAGLYEGGLVHIFVPKP
jgi:hypothetical protein